ncbi:MAG: hypothetical protein HXY34_08385 [Candidatus Thorarchaeota archaeon]|nr:hypothetical protein [Candidatus Thorarchaeota archaeon]
MKQSGLGRAVALFALVLTLSGLFSLHMSGQLDRPSDVLAVQDLTFSTPSGSVFTNMTISGLLEIGTLALVFHPSGEVVTPSLLILFSMTTIAAEKRSERNIKLRDRVMMEIESNPGIHLRELQRTLDCAMGALQYHLQNLETEGAVTSLRIGNTRHIFPVDYSMDEQLMRFTALARNPVVNAIVRECSATSMVTQATLSRNLNIEKSLVSYYTNILVEAGVLRTIRVFGRERPLMLSDWALSVLPVVGL